MIRIFGIDNKIFSYLFLWGLLTGFINNPSIKPRSIEIDGNLFAVTTDGIPPVEEFQITEFVENVFIAHNGLAGKYFGDYAKITYTNGETLNYYAVEIIILQALDPYDPATKYTDGTYIWTSDDIHHRIFNRGVVFATCYDYDGQVGWGRKFIVMRSDKTEKLGYDR